MAYQKINPEIKKEYKRLSYIKRNIINKKKYYLNKYNELDLQLNIITNEMDKLNSNNVPIMYRGII